MQFEQTGIDGLILVKPKIFTDARGFFMETFRQDLMEKAGIKTAFTQENQVFSAKAGVVRAMHYQKPDFAQAKYVGALGGAIFDVVVDLRKKSPTYKKWKAFILSAENKERLFVPRGFAHGYMALEPHTMVSYKVDARYSPAHEAGFIWNDPELGINWPDLPPILAEKDQKLPRLRDLQSPF